MSEYFYTHFLLKYFDLKLRHRQNIFSDFNYAVIYTLPGR